MVLGLVPQVHATTSAGRCGHVSQTTISNSKIQGCCSSFWVLICCITNEKPHQPGKKDERSLRILSRAEKEVKQEAENKTRRRPGTDKISGATVSCICPCGPALRQSQTECPQPPIPKLRFLALPYDIDENVVDTTAEMILVIIRLF